MKRLLPVLVGIFWGAVSLSGCGGQEKPVVSTVRDTQIVSGELCATGLRFNPCTGVHALCTDGQVIFSAMHPMIPDGTITIKEWQEAEKFLAKIHAHLKREVNHTPPQCGTR